MKELIIKVFYIPHYKRLLFKAVLSNIRERSVITEVVYRYYRYCLAVLINKAYGRDRVRSR